MASSRKRNEAVVGLKAGLVQRFGPDSRDIVESEVDGKLAITGGKLDREDIDAIEQRIISRRRSAKKPGGSPSHSRSAPNLGLQSRSLPSPGGFSSAGQRPMGTGSLRQASAGGLDAAAMSRRSMTPSSVGATGSREPPKPPPAKSRTNPPYGISVLGSDPPEIQPCQRFTARYTVPLHPKSKPMDHWDLIIAFDAHKHRQEDATYYKNKKVAAMDGFKGTLDDQMDEVRYYREMDNQALRAEREQMMADTEANIRRKEAEDHVHHDKKEKLKADNMQILQGIARQRQLDKEKKDRDAQRMTDWLESERQNKAKEDRERAVEHAEKCRQAQEEMKAAHEAAKARKKAQDEAERTYVKEQQKAADDAVAVGRQAVADRMAVIERNTATVGAEIAERDAKAERELSAKVKRVQEQSERDAKADAERRKSERDRKVADMLASRKVQCQQRSEAAVADKEDEFRQAKVFKQQYEDGLAKDRAEAEKRRLARDAQDAAMITQMRGQIVVHPLNFGITDGTQNIDVAYNHLMFEQMSREGFMPELTEKLLKDPRRQKADKEANAVACACD